MPPIRICGRSFLVSWDDLTFVSVPSVLIHAAWIVLDFARQVRAAVAELNINPYLLTVDAHVCGLVIVLDVLIGVLSAQGAILEMRRHEKCLKALFVFRTFAGIPLFLIYGYALCTYVVFVFSCVFGGVEEGSFEDRSKHVHGWGPLVFSFWPMQVVKVIMALRFVIVISGAITIVAVLIPKDSHGEMAMSGVRRGLMLFGVSQNLYNETVKVLLDVMGQGATDIVTPSDVVFGVAIVAARQQQGPLFFSKERRRDDDDNEEDRRSEEQPLDDTIWRDGNLPPSVARACEVIRPGIGDLVKIRTSGRIGKLIADDRDSNPFQVAFADGSSPSVAWFQEGYVAKAPRLLDPSSCRDMDALRQITHYAHFAQGIYGITIELLVNSVKPHTSMLTPRRTMIAAWRAMPWRQRKVERPCTVTGDLCCRLHESALRRTLSDHANMRGSKEAELLWATWENRGTGTAPPMAVFLDFETQSVVVAVRGTLDLKDSLGDLIASPVFFDPLGLARKGHPKEPPFDDKTDFFVHQAIRHIARDALSRLEEVGVLHEVTAPGGKAYGCNVVCVGHSLGAGVACLLALLLRASALPQFASTHCVCFEPPGGLLSQKLSDETGRLGFISAVCAHDLIPRLSVRAIQGLRERLIIELETCRRSKWSLALLVCSNFIRKGNSLKQPLKLPFCCLMPVARWFECMAGGQFDVDHIASGKELTRPDFETSRLVINSDKRKSGPAKEALRSLPEGEMYPELWPPRNVVYFRPASVEWYGCGAYRVDVNWTAEWAEPDELHEIIITYRSMELHFPNIIKDAYNSAARNLGAGVSTNSSSSSGEGSDGEGARSGAGSRSRES